MTRRGEERPLLGVLLGVLRASSCASSWGVPPPMSSSPRGSANCFGSAHERKAAVSVLAVWNGKLLTVGPL